MSTPYAEDQSKRTGIALIAHVILSRLLTLIALNLVFLVAALPIVTLPNALAALYRCAGLVLKEEDFPLLKTFFKAFGSEFFKTLAAGWLVFALLLGALYGAVFYWSVNASFALVFAMLCTVMGIFLYAVCCNLFYLLSRVRLSLGALLKNAFLLVFLQPLGRNAYCVVSVALLAICAWYMPHSLPILVLIAFSFAALLACYGVGDLIEKRIVKNEPSR